MAKSRVLLPISGSFSQSTPSGPISFNRSYPDTGIETVSVDQTHGDHVSVNPFGLNRSQVDGGLVGGARTTYTANGLYPSRIYDHRRRALPSLPAVPAGLANKLFANANPDRPEILLPVFAFELRELPGLIRQLGLFNFFSKNVRNHSNKAAAKLWLSGNFGWAPLISDLKKLIEFPDAFARREKEIDDLYANGKGLRRRVNLFSATGKQSTIVIDCDSPDSSLGTNSGTGQPTVDIWGVVRYTPVRLPDGSILKRPTPQDLRRRILGLNAASITLNVWEALPWSWLVDYFVGVGDYLGANPIGRTAVPSGGCVMQHNRCVWSLASKAGPADTNGRSFTITSGRVLTETKSRTIVYPSALPNVLMNPLSGHQLSILGALKVLRARRS